MKKILSILLVFMMMFALLGIASADEYYENGLSKTEEVTIVVSHTDAGNGTTQIEKAKEVFEAMYPNVHVELLISTDMGNIIKTRIAAGENADMPTVIESDGASMPAWIEAGLVEPLDDIWAFSATDTDATLKDLTSDAYYRASFATGWKDGEKHVGAFPVFDGGCVGWFFNKNLFEEKGWNQNPQTWDEFVELCEEIKAEGINPLVCTGVYGYIGMNDCASFFQLASEAGVVEQYEDDYKHLANNYWNNDFVKATFEKLYYLGQEGFFHEGIAAMTHTQAQMQVINGNCAMVISGSWIGNEMLDSTPEGFEWGFMVMPVRETTDGQLAVNASGVQARSIWAGKSDTEKAWGKEFIRVMWDLEVQTAGAACGTISIRSDFVDDPDRLAIYDTAIGAAMKYIADNNALCVYAPGEVTVSDPAYAQVNQKFSDARNDICLGLVDPLPLLDELQEALDAALDND